MFSSIFTFISNWKQETVSNDRIGKQKKKKNRATFKREGEKYKGKELANRKAESKVKKVRCSGVVEVKTKKGISQLRTDSKVEEGGQGFGG